MELVRALDTRLPRRLIVANNVVRLAAELAIVVSRSVSRPKPNLTP
jgi:hypothetical protein